MSTSLFEVRNSPIHGFGGFATQRIRAVLQTLPEAAAGIVSIPHPSPANPRANRDWASQARAVLE